MTFLDVLKGGTAAAFAFLATLVHPALSASIANKDGKDFKITIVEKDARQEHVLKPAAVLDGVCLKGCVVRLDDSPSDEYLLEGGEAVSIEDGNLFHDGELEGAPVKPSEQPAAPSAK